MGESEHAHRRALPRPGQRWRLYASPTLRKRGIAGQVIEVLHVNHCRDARHCFVVGDVGNKRSVSVLLSRLRRALDDEEDS